MTGVDNITRPSLVEKWEASPDLKTWTLRLRKTVKWHNGRQFTADDVVWNLKRVLDPKTGSSVVGLMKGFLLEDVETGREGRQGQSRRSLPASGTPTPSRRSTISPCALNGKSAQLAVPEQLFHYPLLIMDPAENGEFKVGSNGTGAFDAGRANEVGRKQVLKARKEGYWGGGPHLDQLEFIDLGDDPAAAVSALASKQVDGLYGADIVQLEALQKIPHVQMYQVTTAYTATARMQPVKPFDDKRVRQAMRYAIDIERRPPGRASRPRPARRASSRQSPSIRSTRSSRRCHARRRQGEEAARGGGLSRTASTSRSSAGLSPAWELLAVQTMVEQWKEAGIRVKINVMPSTQYWEVWTKVPFGFTTWAHRPLGIMSLALAYRTGVPWNESKYSNAEFDRLLNQAEGTLDVASRREIMARLEADPAGRRTHRAAGVAGDLHVPRQARAGLPAAPVALHLRSPARHPGVMARQPRKTVGARKARTRSAPGSKPLGLLDRLARGPVICAEGYLFEFERRGYLQAGAYVPEIVLERPDLVESLHREFVHAGSDVVEAFTYYAHRAKLRMVGREEDLARINRTALRIAKKVARSTGTLLAGDICNTSIYDPGDVEVTQAGAADLRRADRAGRSRPASTSSSAETYSFGGEALLALEAIRQLRPPGRGHAGHPARRHHAARAGRSPRRAAGSRRAAPPWSARTHAGDQPRRCRCSEKLVQPSRVTWPRCPFPTGRRPRRRVFQSLTGPRGPFPDNRAFSHRARSVPLQPLQSPGCRGALCARRPLSRRLLRRGTAATSGASPRRSDRRPPASRFSPDMLQAHPVRQRQAPVAREPGVLAGGRTGPFSSL